MSHKPSTENDIERRLAAIDDPQRRTVLVGAASVIAASLGWPAIHAVEAHSAPPAIPLKENSMGTITTKDGTQIFFKDWGKGQPVVFSHGWPLSSDDWDAQMLFFLNHGYRVIAHDRRGHGRSSQTADGHDMD